MNIFEKHIGKFCLVVGLLCLVGVAKSATTAVTTPGTWDLSITVASGLSTEAACVDAAKSYGSGTFACTTSTGVKVTVTVDPQDCEFTTSTSVSAWSPAVCPVSGQQSRTVTTTNTVTKPAANGGKACPEAVITSTETQPCTYVPPVDPVPTTDATSVLEDFEGAVRMSSEGTPLFALYDAPGTVSGTDIRDASCARFGAKGWKLTPSKSGYLYPQFFPYVNGWKAARTFATNYQTGIYNRFGFWIKSPVTPTGEWNDMYQWGNYYTGDGASENSGQGRHYYGFMAPAKDVWTYVEFDANQQAWQSHNTDDPAPVSPEYKFFDTLTRFYLEMEDNNIPAGASICLDQFQFRQETGAEDIANIASLEVSYNVSTKKLHIGFQRGRNDDALFTARWSPTKFKVGAFSAGTLLGTSGPNGQGTYSGKRIEGAADLAGLTEVYVAVQKAGRSDFRQIKLVL